MLSRLVTRMDHQAETALTLAEGMHLVNSFEFDVIFLDVRLPDGNGIEVLPEIRRTPAKPEVIIMTGLGDPDGAELAIKNGAWDYIEKPATIDKMKLPLIRALEFRGERAATQAPKMLKRGGIVGDSPPMHSSLSVLVQAAASDANVLITGETGTGKELFARGIHLNSARSEKSFVVVDCAALPETLVESLLFGHVKGSFTGADKRQRGLIEQADGGTLFLDEIGELPLALQRSFLRVIQERRFRPIGADHEIESDFRLICATNRDLEAMIRQGRFREDLFFRLRAFLLDLPALRDHVGDIPELVNHHLGKLCERYKIKAKTCAPDLLEALAAHRWPGNVRELVNALDRTIASAGEEPILYPYHLPTYLRVELARASVGKGNHQSQNPVVDNRASGPMGTLKVVRDLAVERAERSYLEDLMAYTGGIIKKACQVSGLSRGRLYALMKKHDVQRPKK
jgi:two-component system NtrC family response regulator